VTTEPSEVARRRLETELSAALGSGVAVAFSRSRRHAIQLRRERRPVARGVDVRTTLRLAPFFAAADSQVLDDLATWVRHGRRSRTSHARLMAWIDARLAEAPPRALPTWARRSAGHCHDLVALASDLRGAPGAEPLARLGEWPTIGYGRWPSRAPRRSIDLGNYEHERAWVRIHPVLDADWVPAWFVRFVLFHELLHAVAARERWDGGAPHGPTFRAAEARLPDAARAHAWQREHTSQLLARVRAHVRAAARPPARRGVRER
jgi:hypothetical protein